MNQAILRVLTIFLLSIFISKKGFGQVDTSTVKVHITACADTMVKAFTTGDYETMEKFTNAGLVNFLGGREKYIAFMKKIMSEGDMAEVKFEEAAIGKILRVVKTENGFQCLVEQKLTLLISGYRVKAVSPLHGYADKDGKLWKFADVGDKSAEMLKQLIPDLDKRLIIPKKRSTTEKV